MGLPIASELVTVLMKNPFLAYFTVLFVLSTDTFLTGLLFPDGVGVAGYIVTTALAGLGVNIVMTSFHITVIVAVVPVVLFVLKKSGKN